MHSQTNSRRSRSRSPWWHHQRSPHNYPDLPTPITPDPTTPSPVDRIYENEDPGAQTPPTRGFWDRRRQHVEELERFAMYRNDPRVLEIRGRALETVAMERSDPRLLDKLRRDLEIAAMDRNDGWFEAWLVSIMD